MGDVVDRLLQAMNRHDLDGAANLFHERYRSEQPAHPDRAFVGRTQMRVNWEAMFAGIPDFTAEVVRRVSDGNTIWTEWVWSGTREQGELFEARGVALFDIAQEHIVAATLYMEEVAHESDGIDQAVEGLSGRRPRQARR